MSQVWPGDSGFPQQFLVGVNQKNSDSVSEKETDAGTALRRLREDGGWERFSGSVIMTTDHYKEIFRPWFYTTIRRCDSFTWVHPLTQESAECKITKPGFSAKDKEGAQGYVVVSFEIEVAL